MHYNASKKLRLVLKFSADTHLNRIPEDYNTQVMKSPIMTHYTVIEEL